MAGRQTAAGAVAGSGRDQRLDPFSLPVRFAAPIAGKAPGAAGIVYLDRACVVLSRPGVSGMMSVTLPIGAYRGVAVRMEANAEGGLTVILELNHRNPSLSVPLATSGEPVAMAADWQNWSRILGLPLLLVQADGSVSEPMVGPGNVRREAAKPRRRHSDFAARRPRFLVRRKVGQAFLGERIEAAEIIARN